MKLSNKLWLALVGISAVAAVAYASFIVQPIVEQYKGSGAGYNEVIYKLDGNGNVTVDGGLTVNGKVASTVDGSFGGLGQTPATFNTPITMNALFAPLALSSTTINQASAGSAGQIIYCTNCARSAICVSSGTTPGAFVVAVETGTMATPTHCQ